MANQGDSNEQNDAANDQPGGQGNLPAPVPHPAPSTARRKLPPWNVVLHGSDAPSIREVVKTIVTLTPLKSQDAAKCATTAKTRGRALLLTTHRERAELYVVQFANHSVKVTIEAG